MSDNGKCTCGQDHVQNEQPPQSRRKFLGWAVTVINVAVGAVLAVPALRVVMSPLGTKTKEQWFDVLPEGDLAPGQTREVSYTASIVDGYQTVERKYTVYVHRGEDGLKCFDPACTHLGCRIKFQDDKRRYFCPCHGGVFSEAGAVVSGPPPKGLVEHPVKVENGMIRVSRQV